MDSESDSVAATGPIFLSILGNTNGSIEVTADIGSGESVAYRKLSIDPISFVRLEFYSGVSFKVYARGIKSTESVTIEYINAD